MTTPATPNHALQRTAPPPLPIPTQPPSHIAWTVVRIALQVVFSIPSLVILPFIFFGLGLPGIVEVLHGNPLASVPAAIGVLYPVGFALVTISIILPRRIRLLPFLLPLLGAVLFAACSYLLYTKAHWGGNSQQPHRKEMEMLGIFGGTVLVGLWNAIRCVKSLRHATNVA